MLLVRHLLSGSCGVEHFIHFEVLIGERYDLATLERVLFLVYAPIFINLDTSSEQNSIAIGTELSEFIHAIHSLLRGYEITKLNLDGSNLRIFADRRLVCIEC